jgi:hypothetical protein
MGIERYDTLFEDFLTNIVLTQDQANSIDTKLGETLSLFYGQYLPDLDVYAQGSYAMGTTVRPLTKQQSPFGVAGEYDIDIVLERDSWQGAVNALSSIKENLISEYAEKVDSKKRESCERVLHEEDDITEVGFHVDYVPIKQLSLQRHAAKRSEDKWFRSDSKRLIKWFNEYSSSYTFLPAIILVLKRIRDNAGLTNDFSSICITALTCLSYEDKGSYGDDLINVLDYCIAVFDVPYERLSITIEPLEDDLADRITPQQQDLILQFLMDARQKLETGFVTMDLDILRTVLSSSFPADLNKYPENLEALRNRKWGIETDGSLRQVEITEHGESGSFITKVRKRFIGAGEHLVFHANENDRHLYGIRWQVLNAAGSPKRRGSLFEAKGPSGEDGTSSNSFVNHETEQYTGEHWIKYYIYNKDNLRVVEIGKKFFVEVD